MLLSKERLLGAHTAETCHKLQSPAEEAGPSSARGAKTVLDLKSEDPNSSRGSAPNRLCEILIQLFHHFLRLSFEAWTRGSLRFLSVSRTTGCSYSHLLPRKAMAGLPFVCFKGTSFGSSSPLTLQLCPSDSLECLSFQTDHGMNCPE